MNPANLPFDSEAMLLGSAGWVRPDLGCGAVGACSTCPREMAIMGASIERIAGRQGFGGCVRALRQTRRARDSDRRASIPCIPSVHWKSSRRREATNVSARHLRRRAAIT
jgi:hypothetical protein